MFIQRVSFVLGLCFVASCFSDPDYCNEEEGVKLLFLCDPGVEVDHGAKNIPAQCVNTEEKAYHYCTAEQQGDPMLQYEWNAEARRYDLACIPRCESSDMADAWCFETCAAADGQAGVYCIRDKGNQWLLDSVKADCSN